MRARSKQLTAALRLVRLAALVVAFMVMHDVTMTMSPHQAEAGSHHEQVLEGQECGSIEGVAPSIPVPPCGPAPATVTPINLGLAFDSSNSTRLPQIHIGWDSSDIRVWQQVFLN